MSKPVIAISGQITVFRIRLQTCIIWRVKISAQILGLDDLAEYLSFRLGVRGPPLAFWQQTTRISLEDVQTSGGSVEGTYHPFRLSRRW